MKDEIILSEEQQACVNDAVEKFCEGRRLYIISAPAGCGKTTIIPYIVEGLGLSEDEVAYAAFAGKAARVMRDKGMNATTIHHLIYHYWRDRQGYWQKRKKGYAELSQYKLIVIDEISMVPLALLADLIKYKVPLLCLGDNAQLQPIEGTETNRFLMNPDFALSKVFRQKEGSGILDLATQIRETDDIHSYKEDSSLKNVNLGQGEKISISMLNWADVVLCATNGVRSEFNNLIRQSKGITEKYPILYEPIICNHNYWDIISKKGEPLTNGTICIITEIEYDFKRAFNKFAEVTMVPTYDPEDSFHCILSLNLFFELADLEEGVLHRKRSSRQVSCDFAYALTIHKAQGSQYDKVLLYTIDNFGDTSKMLYTGVTRAKEKLIYVQK